jgi:hypothetical protein
MTMAEAATSNRYATELESELNRMVNEQFDSAEFRLLAETPLTMARARFYTLQLAFYASNRRDCWAYVQAKAPWEVKQAIWEHESDELHFDKRGGSDHRSLMTKEAVALGMTAEEVAKAEPSSLITATMWGFNHINITHPWLGAITASHFLERRNNGKVVRGGGASARWRDKLVRELKIDSSLLISSNVHVEADMDHSDSIWESICSYVVDEHSYQTALEGAQACATVDRAFRVALAYEMRQI